MPQKLWGGGNLYHLCLTKSSFIVSHVSRADAPAVALGTSDVWTTIALWWPVGKVLYIVNENKGPSVSLPPVTGHVRSGSDSFVLSFSLWGPGLQCHAQLMRCASAQERAVGGPAVGLTPRDRGEHLILSITLAFV